MPSEWVAVAAALSSRRAVPDSDACVSDLVVRVDKGGDDAADETEAAGCGAGVEAPPQLWVRRAAVWDAPAELRVVGVLSHYAAARRKQLEQRESGRGDNNAGGQGSRAHDR